MNIPLLQYEASIKHEKVNDNVSVGDLQGTELVFTAHILIGQQLCTFVFLLPKSKLSPFGGMQPQNYHIQC